MNIGYQVHTALIVAGLAAICWGLPAAHRLKFPFDIGRCPGGSGGGHCHDYGRSADVYSRFFQVSQMKEKMKSILVNGGGHHCHLPAAVSGRHLVADERPVQPGRGGPARGDFPGAVAGFESALHMYIPFHPTIEKAAEQLWQIGESSERAG